MKTIEPSSHVGTGEIGAAGKYFIAKDVRRKSITSDVIITDDEIEKTFLYLKDPISYGIWRGIYKEHPKKGIFEFVKSEINNALETKKGLAIQYDNKYIRIPRNRLFEDQLQDDFRKVSTILTIFTYIFHNDNGTLEDFYELYNEKLSFQDRFILENLDIKKLKKKFNNEYDFFQKEIYFEGFYPVVPTHGFFRFKSGLVISIEMNKTSTVFFALDRKSLEKFFDFLERLLAVSETNIEPVFSPEEDAFVPYFLILRQSYTRIIDNETLLRLFQKAIDEYSKHYFPHCIGTIGIIFEDMLIQIYETYFRKAAPKNRSIGELYDSINACVQGTCSKKKKKTKVVNVDSIYKDIKKTDERLNSSDIESSLKDIIRIVRDLTTYAKSEIKETKKSIEENTKKSPFISVFPRFIRDNITEVLRYRNAISHKSRIPIGEYEAIRAVYSCITLILWWKDEKNAIDWNDGPREIIRKSVERNREA